MEYTSVNGFSSLTFDKVRHEKVLPYLSVVQAVEGNYDIKFGNDKIHNTGKGGYFIAPANIHQTIIHNADEVSGRMTCRWAFLKVKINDVYYFEDIYSFPTILPHCIKNEMNTIFKTLFGTDSVVDKYICYYQIVKLLLSVSREKEHHMSSYIGIATTFIKNHYMEKLQFRILQKRLIFLLYTFFLYLNNKLEFHPLHI